MLPFVVGAIAVIAAARELFNHPDVVREREIEAYKKGDRTPEEASDRINKAYQNYYLSLDDSDPRRDEINAIAQYKKAIANHKEMNAIDLHDYIRVQAVRAFNKGEISQERLDQEFAIARTIKEKNG